MEWRLEQEPTFDNQFATLDIDGDRGRPPDREDGARRLAPSPDRDLAGATLSPSPAPPRCPRPWPRAPGPASRRGRRDRGRPALEPGEHRGLDVGRPGAQADANRAVAPDRAPSPRRAGSTRHQRARSSASRTSLNAVAARHQRAVTGRMLADRVGEVAEARAQPLDRRQLRVGLDPLAEALDQAARGRRCRGPSCCRSTGRRARGRRRRPRRPRRRRPRRSRGRRRPRALRRSARAGALRRARLSGDVRRLSPAIVRVDFESTPSTGCPSGESRW